MYGMDISDYQLENAINMLFIKHDYNMSGFLSVDELQDFFNDLFMQLGMPYRVNSFQAR